MPTGSRSSASLWSVPHKKEGKKSGPVTKPDTYCHMCQAVFHVGQWSWNEARLKRLQQDQVAPILCDADRKMQLDLPSGILTLLGMERVNTQTAEELRVFLENEATSALRRNPEDRLMRLQTKTDEWLVYTTSEALAGKLANALHRRFSGRVTREHTNRQKVSRVMWIAP